MCTFLNGHGCFCSSKSLHHMMYHSEQSWLFLFLDHDTSERPWLFFWSTWCTFRNDHDCFWSSIMYFSERSWLSNIFLNKHGCFWSSNVTWYVPFWKIMAVFVQIIAGEITAHKTSINTIATNGTCIFTGSRWVW